jgi:hypothetical protein
MGWAGHVAYMEEMTIACNILICKPEGNRTLGNPGRRCEDNIKMYLTEVGCKDVDWIHLAHDREQWRIL